MASQISITNMALSHIGMEPIISLSSDSPSALAANLFWVPSRDDVFSEHRWPFANVQAPLATVSDEIVGWDYIYAYPAQCARLFNVYDEGSVDSKEIQEFEVVYITASNKRVVCSNLETAYAEYTYKVSDTTVWDAKFVVAFSYRLAAAMAHTLTGDVEKGLKVMEIYNAFMGEAKRLSYQEKFKKPYRTSSSYDAR